MGYRSRRWVWLAVAALSACSTGVRDDAPTIATLSDRPVELAADVAAEDSARKAVEAYQRFLDSAPQSALRPEAMRRLADLERELHEEQQLGLGEDEAPAEPAGAAYIGLYEELHRSFPNDPRSDQVMYQLARSYEDANRREEAIEVLGELVNRRPGSPLAAEAQFRRGEILFVDGDHSAAAQAYTEVLRHGESSPYFEHAQYKLGWANFKLSRYEEGLDAFTAVLDYKLGDHSQMSDLSRADRERVDDTLRAMGLAFIYQSGTDSALAYYSSRGGRAYESVVFAKLGEIYLDKEQFTDAAGTYQAFAKRNPFHRDAPAFHAKIIDAYVRADFKELVLEAKEEFVATYRLGAPYWEHYQPVDRPDVLTPLKANVSDLASHYHALAQSTRKAEDYRQAERWYRVYIDSFPDDPGTPGINFLLAEALFEQQRFPEAVSEYERTAYEYPPHEKSSEAGYAALLAYAEAAKPLQGEPRLAWDRRATDSALLFEVTFPEHPQSAAVLTKASEELYRFGEADRANEAARRVLEGHPEATPALRRTAWTVVGHSDFDLQNYAQAEQAYGEVLRLVPADDTDRGDLVERMAASVYKQGESARDRGQLGAAAGHFLRVGQVAPSSEITAIAQYDAAAAYLALSDWGQAASVLEGFRSAYPAHELRGEVDRKLAAAYLNDGQLIKAAGEFENLGLTGAGTELEAQGLQQSADLYRQAGARADEARVLVSYVKRFPTPLEPAVEARYRLAELAREGGQTKTYHLWLSEVVDADRAAGSERTDRTRYLAAQSLIVLAGPKLEAYKRVRLVEPIKQNLREKKQRMEQAINVYTEAADYGVPDVVTEATFQIANLYYDFSQSLFNSERPKGLDADELEQYEILLEEQAFPFEEQAIEVHEINLARIPEGVYDDWVKRSLDQLARLVPVRYAKSERSVVVATISP